MTGIEGRELDEFAAAAREIARRDADTPDEVTLKLRSMATWAQIEDALTHARTMARRRREGALHHWLDRAASLFLSLPEQAGPFAPVHVSEYETRELVTELRRRARTERDKHAAEALHLPLPRRPRL